MRIADILYFAPGIRFAEVDRSGAALPAQFESCIRGFYLDPALRLADDGHGFAAGVLLVVTVDAIARVDSDHPKVGARIRDWCERRIPGLSTADLRDRFYDDFRNGLVHESRIKNGSEFDLRQPQVAVLKESRVILNPLLLAHEISTGVASFVETLQNDKQANQTFVQRIAAEFDYEFTQ